MPRKPEKKIVIIAGPNGAGKTTFACEYLWAVYDNSGEVPKLIEEGVNP
jgi:predicted ABC-type ATPase